MAEAKKTAAVQAADTKKEEVKEVKEVKEVVKEAPKAETKKRAGRKPAVKKAAEKKTTAKKAAAKETTTRTAGRKPAVKATIEIQFAGNTHTQEELIQSAKDIWEYDLHKAPADFKTVELYVKPEENKVYYVINNGSEDEAKGDFNF